MDLIASNLAYSVHVNGLGTFVCLDFTSLCAKQAQIYSALSPRPVMYPVLKGLTRHPEDCALWAPYIEGAMSPWGRGQATINATYVLDRLQI